MVNKETEILMSHMVLYVILLMIHDTTQDSQKGCLQNVYPVVDICSQETLTADIFLVEFSTFETSNMSRCACDIIVNLAFYLEIELQVSSSVSPCGTKVSIGPFPRYDYWTRKDILFYEEIQCKRYQTRKERNDLFEDKLTLSVEKLASNYSSRLCMVFAVEAWNGSMTIRCYDPLLPENIPDSTTNMPTHSDIEQNCYVEAASFTLTPILVIVILGVTIISYFYYRRHTLVQASESVYMGLMDVHQRDHKQSVSTIADVYSEGHHGPNHGPVSVADLEDVYDEIYY